MKSAMRLAIPLRVAADLSEAALEEAWEQAHKPESFSLIVGTQEVSVARTLKLHGKPIPWIWVNPAWTSEWTLNAPYIAIFSEATG